MTPHITVLTPSVDDLECVGEEGGYRRIEIEVVATGAAARHRLAAFAYLQDPTLLDRPGAHVGPVDEYTLVHAQSLRW